MNTTQKAIGAAILFVAVIAFAVIATAFLTSTSAAAEPLAIRGSYGWHSVVSFYGYSTGNVSTGVGVFDFQRNGVVTGSYVGKFNWDPVTETFTGTYTVGVDGRGTLEFTQASNGAILSYSFVLVDRDNEIDLVNTQAGINQVLIAKKQ